ADVDARSDVWAVGATMFAVLSGEPVHDGDTVQEVLIAAATRPARLLRDVAALLQLPAGLVGAVDRALSFARALRWADARAMQRALREEADLVHASSDATIVTSGLPRFETPLPDPPRSSPPLRPLPPPRPPPRMPARATAAAPARVPAPVTASG